MGVWATKPARGQACRGAGRREWRAGWKILSLLLTLAVGCGGRSAKEGEGAPARGGGVAGGGHPGVAAAAGASSAEGGSAGFVSSAACAPGRAPLRRLTKSEYAASIRALFPDAGDAANALPLEPSGFPVGNLAEDQTVSPELARAYFDAAKAIAKQATGDPTALVKLAPCAASVTADTADACARSTIAAFASKAFRRAPSTQEVDELLVLHAAIRSAGGGFADATAGAIAAVLQAPDFLYRIEWGVAGGSHPDSRQLSGDELASRLSYLFWGGPPDDALRAAAASGSLLDADGVRTQAARLLADPRSHLALASFFDDFFELQALTTLQRSDATYVPSVGTALQKATQRFLEHEIFDKNGSWPSVLRAPSAFVNDAVSSFYGVTGITGAAFREVPLDTTQRLGLLTQPSLLMVALRSDTANPTQRGFRVMEKLLCRVVPPEPPGISEPQSLSTDAPTARQRWVAHSANPACASCHTDMDQLGFALENFDAMARYRSQENGVPIDTKVVVTGIGSISGPVDLAQKLAALPEAQACFSRRLAEFGLGKHLGTEPADLCLAQNLSQRFEAAGYNVQQLLLELTKTEAFLYLPKGP